MATTEPLRDITICAVCDQPASFQWTDTHGVAVCITCGLPYVLYHYEDNQPVDMPPTVAIKEEWIPLAREYWRETGRRVFPGDYDMGIFTGRTRTYSGATAEEMREFDNWMTAHKDRWPAQETTNDKDSER